MKEKLLHTISLVISINPRLDIFEIATLDLSLSTSFFISSYTEILFSENKNQLIFS